MWYFICWIWISVWLYLIFCSFSFRAVFKFDQNNRLGVTAKGKDFPDFKAHFGNDDRGFGYIRIKVLHTYNSRSKSIFNTFVFFQTGDEMSKRAKFVMVTWIGPGVSVMKKAKMSTDKALMKDICQVNH